MGLHEGNKADKLEAYTQELFRLKLANPTLEIKFFVSSEEVCEDFKYSEQTIESVDLSEWVEYNDKIFTDEGSYIDEVVYCEEIEASEVDTSCMSQVILVKLGA